MNILIICTAFPPDTAIAAKRPYLFAKYLSLYGHDVTVIRSGNISKGIDKSFDKTNELFEVISYLGANSLAEQYENGKSITLKENNNAEKLKRIPTIILGLMSPFLELRYIYRKWKSSKKSFDLCKSSILKLKGTQFDVVFSTYSDFETIFAGEYAAKMFHCKWILDFRDLIVQPMNSSILWNFIGGKIQDKTISTCDVCTVVSQGLKEGIIRRMPSCNKIEVLYNGYDGTNANHSSEMNDDIFRFCYVGEIYSKRKLALEYFLKTIKSLIDDNKICLSKLEFLYAGSNQSEISPLLEQYGLKEIFRNYGYVSKGEAMRIQDKSDIFVVLSWNTKYEQGILTGKFYEGIRAKKPILSLVVGDTPHSELYELNKQFNYGFCFEESQKEVSITKLEDFIFEKYSEKIANHHIDYIQSEELEKTFRYDYLTKQLEKLCLDLTKNDKTSNYHRGSSSDN